MVQHIQNAAEARAVLEACRFSLQGHRSPAGSVPVLGYGALPQPDINRRLNENTLLIAMLETPTAIENVEALAAVDRIDTRHIGATDLSTQTGIAGDYKHSRMRAAFEAVARAAKAHGNRDAHATASAARRSA